MRSFHRASQRECRFMCLHDASVLLHRCTKTIPRPLWSRFLSLAALLFLTARDSGARLPSEAYKITDDFRTFVSGVKGDKGDARNVARRFTRPVGTRARARVQKRGGERKRVSEERRGVLSLN